MSFKVIEFSELELVVVKVEVDVSSTSSEILELLFDSDCGMTGTVILSGIICCLGSRYLSGLKRCFSFDKS